MPQRAMAPDAAERRLVARMRAGDERAFAVFADSYLPGLYRFARRRLGGDAELTRDIVQSTACKALASLDGWRGEAPLFTWLCACCRNEIAAHFRHLGRRPREVALDAGKGGADVVPRASQPGPQEEVLREEAAELVHAALDQLPESWGRALEWRYLEGLSVPEIADRLASTYKATESLLSRARGAFRELYARLAGGQVEDGPAAPAREVARR
jgi:RNA polymerase sigma-70 factor (ECF subfamily)